ncbi:MAG: hypothetical protein CFE23_14415 [Flavobacterium sp. BFFFF1]|uniref:hypothetical protein n=1 Tax=Flavobacterium sp. BFFFF1 TaxID=2015557 RepID=UPI000BCD1130|nr:hypothetical protein [Flavobacterium sp. BFFFF1]OYU79359.1 MAG: hypothetical protein CFE23_14415 [Flavobacterium sp. BFFFF1]
MKNWIFILLSFSLYSQTENSKLLKHDFSSLWLGNEIVADNETKLYPETVGFIGDNYQRFFIKLLRVEKDEKNPNPSQYLVNGKIMFNGYKSKIKGTIEVESASSDEGCTTIAGKYYFNEYIDNEKITAAYEGTFTSRYVLKNDEIEYCTSDFSSDGFYNNQFSGTREDFVNIKTETCNWGDFRIFESGDLDIGAGEFSVNLKYVKNGWLTYMLAHSMPYCDSNGIHNPSPEEIWWKD